jgi:NAD(P)-dependent dehydrogenase (short-subunit alcohol dehydrogenase family)
MTDSPTILITGATDGLGCALAHHLAGEGAHVIIHGRNPDKLERTAESISRISGTDRPATVVADLADLAQVRRLAADVQQMTDRLDVLVNNAGIGAGEPDGHDRRVSADGYELRFAVNYLSTFLLTLDLLPLLRNSVPARIVNVASIRQDPIDFDNLMLEHDYNGTLAYGQSKLAQVIFGFDLANRFSASELTVNSLHPATYMPTKMVLAEVGHSIDSLESGVATTARLISDPDLAGTTAKFFDRNREAKANAQAYDEAVRTELWRRSLELVGRPDLD